MSPFFFILFFIFFIFIGVDTCVRDSKLVIPKGAMGSIQAASFQIAQGVEGFLAPTRGDTSMGKTPGVATLDPALGLPTFLARFDLWSLTASLPATFITSASPMAASYAFLCLWKTCHC